MEGVSARATEYLRLMDKTWAPDDEETVAREPMKVRIPEDLKAQMESISAIETGVKKEKNPKVPTEVSLSTMVTAFLERAVAGWGEEWNVDTKSLPKAPAKRGQPLSEDVMRVARHVLSRREREERKKK